MLWLPWWAIIARYHESQIATPDCSAVLVPVCVNIMTGSGCQPRAGDVVTIVTNLHCSQYITLCQLQVWWPETCNGLPGVYSTGVLVAVVGTTLRKDTGVQILCNRGIPGHPGEPGPVAR